MKILLSARVRRVICSFVRVITFIICKGSYGGKEQKARVVNAAVAPTVVIGSVVGLGTAVSAQHPRKLDQ